MTAFLGPDGVPVKTYWFGSRPSDEWVYKLADEANLGKFEYKSVPSHVKLDFTRGWLEVHKHFDSKGIPNHERENVQRRT